LENLEKCLKPLEGSLYKIGFLLGSFSPNTNND
jgi:hypothetical protein